MNLINKISKKDKVDLYSFDIFDTLITRKVATPKGIFALMQEELKNNSDFSNDFKNNFYNIRIDSEKYARSYAKSQNNYTEINFDDIYAQMQRMFSLSDNSIKFLKELEVQLEIKNLIGIQENIDILKDLVNQNNRVILISDMYYGSDMLHKLLSNIDSIFDNLKIYVSSEYKVSKGEGTLYSIVQKKENVKFKHWVHFGDNLSSDIKKAKHYGIKAIQYDLPQLMPYEKELINLYQSYIDIQYMIGTAKITRLNKQEKNQDKYNFGASFSAQILYNYVSEILTTALEKGFKNLYFIARDGYIPKLIADIIIKEKNLPIKANYIYGSRFAWRLPNEENYEYFIEINMKEYRYKLSLNFLAYRFGISADTLAKYVHVKSNNAILNYEQVLELKNSLLYDNSLKMLVLNSYKGQRETLLNYLKQEIDFSERTFAFVEINGSGKTQLFLSDHLNQITPCSVFTFYITVSPDHVKNTIQQHVFCTKPRTYNTSLELLCRTTYGQTIGYKKEENQYVPILEDFNASALLEWGYEEYLQGIIDYTKNLLKYEQNFFSKEMFYTYFDYIADRCDQKTASILGDVPFLLVGKEIKAKKAAPELNVWTFILCHIFKQQILKYTQYPKLSFARGNKIINYIEKTIQKFQYTSDYIQELKFIILLKRLKNHKIVLWGASIFLDNLIKRWNISTEDIIAIVDKNPNRIGQSIGIYPIVSPENLHKYKPNFVIMTIKNNNRKNYEDISNEIRYNYRFTNLIQNFFDTSLISIIQRKRKQKYCTLEEINARLINMERSINRQNQTNLSTAMLHQKTFLPFKNKHSNQEIVIIASGPTARLYKPIENAIHIGVNRSFQINNGAIPLDYVFIQDFSGATKDYIDDLDNYRPDSCQKFYGLTNEWVYDPERTIPETHAIRANALRYRTDWAPLTDFIPQFAYDISTQPLGCFGSIMFPALQFALWTNPKRIYLVGCDCTLSGYAYDTSAKNSLNAEDFIASYMKFKDFANKYYPDIEIVSINPVGLKGIFIDKYDT